MRTVRSLAALALCAALTTCTNTFSVDLPEWPGGGHLAGLRALTANEKAALEGIYVVEEGNGQFGDTLVLKWNGDYLGVYAGVHVAYMVMQAGGTDTSAYIEGYWRYQNTEATGLAEMSAPLPLGGAPLRLTGTFGNGGEIPSQPMAFRLLRPIDPALLAKPYYIISHHGSGGTPGLLPASENTIEIARIIERYGANAIEVDVRPTKDGIPVLYHDTGLNWRLVQKGPLVGPVENYTFAQLEAFVTLLGGEKIPSLEAFLDTVITQTTLQFIYVDLKPTTPAYLPTIVAIQQAALAKAAGLGRNIQIYLAITTDDILASFLALPGYQNIPTICELSIDKMQQANSHVWSPRFTQDIPSEDIALLHSEGKLAITWTVNVPSFLQQFIEQGELDGVLSDYTTLAAYYYYKQ